MCTSTWVCVTGYARGSACMYVHTRVQGAVHMQQHLCAPVCSVHSGVCMHACACLRVLRLCAQLCMGVHARAHRSACVCMNVCVCAHVCRRACMCFSTSVRASVCTAVQSCAGACRDVHTDLQAYELVCVYACVCISTMLCICECVHNCVYKCASVCTEQCMCVCGPGNTPAPPDVGQDPTPVPGGLRAHKGQDTPVPTGPGGRGGWRVNPPAALALAIWPRRR